MSRFKPIQDPAKTIKEYYEKFPFTKECFRKRCGEKGCKLSHATHKNFLILDGDKIKECRGHEKSSVDCILIKHEYSDEESVLFVELSTKKSLKKIVKKFKDSYEEIFRAFKETQMEMPKQKFIYLGRLKTSHERKLISSKNIPTNHGKTFILNKTPPHSVDNYF